MKSKLHFFPPPPNYFTLIDCYLSHLGDKDLEKGLKSKQSLERNEYLSNTSINIYRFIKRSCLLNVNPRHWDLNCILETFLAAGRGEQPGLPVNISKVFPEDRIVEAQLSPACKQAAPGPPTSPRGDVVRGTGVVSQPLGTPGQGRVLVGSDTVQAQPLGMGARTGMRGLAEGC